MTFHGDCMLPAASAERLERECLGRRLQGHHPAAFPFFYISPATPELNLQLTRKYTGNITRQEAEKIAPIGNAPTMMTFADLKKVSLCNYARFAECIPTVHCKAQGAATVKLPAACEGGADMDEPQPSHLPRRGDCQGVGLGAGAMGGCPDIAHCKTSMARPRAGRH
jgi:hypothetical protein